MRTLILPFALLLCAAPVSAGPHDHHHGHAHDNPGAHEHGVATLSVAIEGSTLMLALETPAMNIVGFEHQPANETERATVQAARQSLQAPLELFALPAAAGCRATGQQLESPLFKDDHGHGHQHDDASQGHSDIDASYTLECSQPERLTSIDLAPFFARFPQTERIVAQAISPNGQHGADLTAARARLEF